MKVWMKVIGIISLFIGIFITFNSCDRDRLNPFDPKNPNAEIIKATQTKIPSDDPNLVKDTLIGDKVYLTYEEGATLPEFQEGDIIIGLRGEGYLRRVTNYTSQGNQIILETEQSTIKDAFTKLVIDTVIDVIIPEEKLKLKGINYKIETKGYDIKVSSSGLRYEGKQQVMRFEWPNFVIEIRSGDDLAVRFKAQKLILYSDFSLRFQPQLDSSGLYLLISEIRKDSLKFTGIELEMNKEIPLLKQEISLLPPISIPIIIWPIVLTLEYGVDAELQSILTLTYSMESQGDASLYFESEVGAEYDHGDWRGIWEKDLNGESNLDSDTTANINSENKCGLELEGDIKLYGVAGGGLWTRPYCYFDLNYPPLHYEGGAGIAAGTQLSLGIWGWEIEWEKTFATYEKKLFESTQGENPPDIPAVPSGPDSGYVSHSYTFSSSATDPDGDQVSIRFDWGDGDTSNWSNFVNSGQTISMSHSYLSTGTYYIKAQAKDDKGNLSDWSSTHSINIQSSTPGENHYLYYRSDKTGSWQIYRYNMNTGVEAQLTNETSLAGASILSNDGMHIFYLADNEGNPWANLYMINSDGSGKTLLLSKTTLDSLGFYHLGPRIAGISRDDDTLFLELNLTLCNTAIYALEISTRTLSLYFRPESVDVNKHDCYRVDSRDDGLYVGNLQNGCWSPTLEIYTFNVVPNDVSNVNKLTSNSYSDEMPMWSYDGTKIIFSRSDNSQGYGNPRNIYIMDEDGTNEVKLTSLSGNQAAVNYCVTTNKIYYNIYDGSKWSIWRMNYDGSSQEEVLSDTSYSVYLIIYGVH